MPVSVLVFYSRNEGSRAKWEESLMVWLIGFERDESHVHVLLKYIDDAKSFGTLLIKEK